MVRRISAAPECRVIRTARSGIGAQAEGMLRHASLTALL